MPTTIGCRSFLETCVEFLFAEPEVIAVSTASIARKAGRADRIIPAAATDPTRRAAPRVLENFFDFWAAHDHVRTGSVVIRQAVVDRAGRQRADLRISQDLEYWGLLATHGKWGFIPQRLFVTDGTPAAAASWLARYEPRRRLCPTVEQWQARILPRLQPQDRAGFRIVRGRVAGSFAHAKVLAGDDHAARAIVNRFGAEFSHCWSHQLMRLAARQGRIGWSVCCRLLRYRESAKARCLAPPCRPLRDQQGVTMSRTQAMMTWRPNATRSVALAETSLPALLAWGLALALICRKTVFARQRWGEGAFAAVDVYAIVEIGLVAAACLLLLAQPAIWSLVVRRRRTSLVWFMAFYAVGMVSALWSQHASYSLFMSAEALSQTLLIMLALQYAASFAQAEKWILRVTSINILFGMCVNMRFYGLSFQLRDWHTNSYSAIGAMLLCYCTAEYFRADSVRARRLMAYGIFGLMAVALGTSGASSLAVLCGLGAAALLLRQARWPLIVFLGLCVFAALSDPQSVLNVLFPGRTAEQVIALRGRWFVWEQLADYIVESPLLGHGFAMGARLGDVSLTNTHNALLSVLLGTGLLGVVIMMAGLFRWGREVRVAARARIPGLVGCNSALIVGLVNSMSLGFLGEAWRDVTFTFACFLVLHTWALERWIVQYHARRRSPRVAVSGPVGGRESQARRGPREMPVITRR